MPNVQDAYAYREDGGAVQRFPFPSAMQFSLFRSRPSSLILGQARVLIPLTVSVDWLLPRELVHQISASSIGQSAPRAPTFNPARARTSITSTLPRASLSVDMNHDSRHKPIYVG